MFELRRRRCRQWPVRIRGRSRQTEQQRTSQISRWCYPPTTDPSRCAGRSPQSWARTEADRSSESSSGTGTSPNTNSRRWIRTARCRRSPTTTLPVCPAAGTAGWPRREGSSRPLRRRLLGPHEGPQATRTAPKHRRACCRMRNRDGHIRSRNGPPTDRARHSFPGPAPREGPRGMHGLRDGAPLSLRRTNRRYRRHIPGGSEQRDPSSGTQPTGIAR